MPTGKRKNRNAGAKRNTKVDYKSCDGIQQWLIIFAKLSILEVFESPGYTSKDIRTTPTILSFHLFCTLLILTKRADENAWVHETHDLTTGNCKFDNKNIDDRLIFSYIPLYLKLKVVRFGQAFFWIPNLIFSHAGVLWNTRSENFEPWKTFSGSFWNTLF